MRRGRARYKHFWARRDVSFEVEPGQTFALVGQNGSGKSAMLMCLARILRPDEAPSRSTARCRPCSSWAPGLHPELSGRESVRERYGRDSRVGRRPRYSKPAAMRSRLVGVTFANASHAPSPVRCVGSRQ